MAGLLKQAKHELVEDEAKADIVLFNTCTVKTPSENKFLRELKKTDKKVVLAGCVPQSEPMRFDDYSLIGTRQIDNVVEVVEKTANGETLQLMKRNVKPNLLSPTVRRNSLVETIPISLGCLSACSFCKTKAARGGLSSYPEEEIVDNVRRATSEGVSEIWLTSQDTGCYGFDIGTNLAELLEEICKIEKEFMIRVGMANPDHILKIKDELISAFKHGKVFKFLHIPVQAGNDDVLKDMKRAYTVEQAEQIIDAFRKEIPEITISTDIICGFPTETEEQFNDTLELMKKVRFDIVNISRYWPRPGTPAAKLKQWPDRIRKERSTKVTDLFDSQGHNDRWVGWEGTIIIDEKGKDGSWVGRNYSYKPVIVKGDLKLGDKVKVKIEKATVYDLRGVLI